jgi:transcriptional regulator with XRE-family HTH domain
MNKSFGLNLKVLREKFGMSQDQLAGHIGLKKAAISKYEKDLAEPKINHLIKFCEIFSVTLDTLILDNASHNEKLSDAEYIMRLKALEDKNVCLENENATLKDERDKLQKRLIKVLELALKQS